MKGTPAVLGLGKTVKWGGSLSPWHAGFASFSQKTLTVLLLCPGGDKEKEPGPAPELSSEIELEEVKWQQRSGEAHSPRRS